MSAEPSFPTASGDTLDPRAPHPARGGPAGESYAFPPSFAQERMWFLEQLRPGSPLYHVRARLRLAGGLDVPALRRALAELLRRHEALRTVFREVEGSPLQVVHPPVPMELPVADLRALRAPAAETEAARLAAEGASRPFDLERGPVLRTWLVRSGGAEHHLLLTVHHIAFDGWSAGVFFRELADLYGAFARGLPSPLPEPEVQYADYALWQREWLSGEVLDRELEFWRERLRGAPPLLELPLDRSRPAVQGHRGATRRFLLPAELAAALRRLAREEGATLFMALLGGVSALLSRYSGQTDMLLGTPVAGRMSPELEGVVGLFVNTLVLRGDLSGDPSFRGLLRRVRDTTLDAYAHQELPFERLVEALGVERSLGHHPLFQVMLALQNAAWEPVAPAGLAMELVEVPGTTSKFDLSLLAHEQAQGALSVAVEYAGDLFEDATVEALARHLRVLLESAAARPEARLSGLSLLDAREERQVLAEWNRTARAYPRDLCVHHLFELQAGRTPDAVAVVSGGDALSYAELDRAADRMADRLRPLGVGPDARVGLCAERGADLLVGLLGILKAGAACVPLDPAYPAERLAFMLEDSAMPVLVAHEHLAERLPTSGVSVVHLGAGALSAAVPSGGSRAPAPGPENLAYVIYTSGSTGRPKGVAMPHRPLVNLLAWQERDWRAPGPATTLQFATISFDASFHEIFSCWAAGGTLVLAPEDARRDPDAVLSLVEEGGVERLFLPFVALQQVAERAVALGLAPARLREVQTAGEQLRVTGPIRRWLGALGAPLYNHYGPSETHVVTSRVLEGGTDAWPLLPPIGRPVANTSCYVLDATLRPVPAGVPGELFVGGESLARGYLGQPGLTAERFLPDPFGAAGARMYRTGDRVRWLAAGELEFLGRTDRQVKLRGFRVEPEEVAAALERHPGVREAVAAVRADPAGDPRLVAYVVPAAPGVPPAPTELRQHAARVLPDYMVPSAFVVLEHLPLTASGKTDHRALPAPDYASAGEYLAPRTAAEEVLAGIWSHVLRLDRVGVLDNFFALGGHSLLATRVVSRVREAFRTELPLRALFEAPTVAALAERVEAGLGWRGGAEPPPPRPAPRDPLIPLPLSFAQQRLWLLEQMDPGGAAYLVPTALRLRGPLDVQLLRVSLADLAARHQSLRTRFPAVDGSPVQLVEGAAPVPLPVAELERVADGDREALLARIAADEARRPFDLAAGPVFRAALARLGGEEWVLFLTLHHIVCDGWSMGVLLRDLAALHGARVRGGAADLPALPVQYADYARWQRGWLRGEVLDRQLAFWRTRLAGAPPLLELPTDRPRLPGGRAPGAGCRRVLPAGPTAGLRTLARREGATLFMALLAAWQVLLARYSGQDDVVSGIPVANRPRTELEGVVGFFVNTLPVRTTFHGAAAFTDVLAGVREATLGALAHQDLPFERLVEELEIGRSPGHAPLVQVMFVLSDAEEADLRLGDARVEPMEATGAAAKFDLTLSAAPVDGELRLALGYRADLWEEATIAAMLEHFARLLEGAASGPAAHAFELPLLSDGERGRVLGWSRGPGGPPPRRCVHELFEAQADRTPGAVAVVFGEEAATYAELEARANRLARHLRGLGVGPETRVGVCLERSTEMVVALLGVLKAGGAYVPLDPSYPAERLAFMLEDAAAPVLLTESGVAAGLPAVGGRVVCLDAEAERIAAHGPERAGVEVGPENLAYVIYTSGSTGRPKGAMNAHRGVVNRLLWMRDEYGIGASDSVLQKTPFSFDVSVWEFFLPLLAGARLVVARPEGHRDPAYLADLVEREGVTTLHFVPPMLRLFLEEPRLERCGSLRRVVCSGEALPPDLQASFLERLPWAGLHNLYGPTEAAVDVTAWACRPGGPARSVPIGRPVSNTRVYVVDRDLRPVPAGVPGELLIGGVQVGRGYLARPALTAERFVPDPFSGSPGARLYRTGDLAAWRPAGVLEFLGRIDHQVKVHGFRIELGEIEATLGTHPDVRDVVVAAREDAPGDRRLVAYVVPGEPARPAERGEEAGAAEQVSQWESVFDQAYGQSADEGDPTFNIAGWNSSYSGLPIPAEEMREWVDRTVARIAAGRPGRVLEIGCGTGLLLFRLAPACARYWGTDISPEALRIVRRNLPATGPGTPEVRLLQRPGHDFSGIEPRSFDAVVLNSVVQYFPGVEYLVEVLAGAVDAVGPGGFVFVGDVRSLPLLEMFHAAVEFGQAADSLAVDRLRARVRRRVAQEQELVVDPAFFAALRGHLPRVSRVEVQLKRGRRVNELAQFRYDVLLHVERGTLPPPAERLAWEGEGADPAGLRRRLEAAVPALELAGVPNARVAEPRRILELLAGADAHGTVGSLRSALAREDRGGADPESFHALGEELGYDVQASWTPGTADGRFDVRFHRRGSVPGGAGEASVPGRGAAPAGGWKELANDPLRVRALARLVPELREWARERLPEHMVPSDVVVLDELPLSPSGKLDRGALPAPEYVRSDAFVAPRTEVERILAGVWAEVLGVQQVGIHDNFFEMGGDSIRSIQVVVRAARQGVSLTPKLLFQNQALGTLAAAAGVTDALAGAEDEADAAAAGAHLEAVRRMPGSDPGVEDAYPLTPMQESMLFQYLRRGEPGLYVVHNGFDLERPGLDVPLLERAFQAVIDRNPNLRTSFLWEGTPEPLQVVHARAAVRLEVEDWRGLAPERQDWEFREYVREARRRGFDLSRAPHTRLALFRLADDRVRLFWGFNYMLQDGWSLPILLEELFAFYDAFVEGREPVLEARRPFRDHLAWIARQDPAEAEAFWRQTLAGAGAPLRIVAPGRRAAGGGEYASESTRVSAATTAALGEVARRHRLTVNTLVQGAWALLLAHRTGEHDVVFGSFLSGRNPALSGVERMVGFFNNLLPVRARIAPAAPLPAWLKEIQLQQVEARQYEYTGPLRIAEWTGNDAPELFESYIVFENFPISADARRHLVDWRFANVDNLAQTEHPLRVVIHPRLEMQVDIMYYTRHFDAREVDGLLSGLVRVLDALAQRPDGTVGDLLRALGAGGAAA